MVKKVETSISQEDEEEHIINENGKRSAETEKYGQKRIRTKSLYRQPTAHELNRLQETESLFNSNLFRLQVEEVLQEVKLKEKTVKKFEEWFLKFKDHLLDIPNDETEYDLTEKSLSKRIKVKLPVSASIKKTKAMFKFHKFREVEIVGSYSLETAISSKLIVNVQITVPAETYTKNDSINYRYHKKRAAYLACIASHLNKFDYVEDLKYAWLNGSEVKPVLEFKPKGKLGSHLSIRLHLTCEEEAYKLHRFTPTRNNLRESWLFEEKQENNEIGPPTPYYNSSVLCDLTASINEQFLKATFKNSDNLRQGVVLLKIWLRQRRLQVSGHIVSLFVAHLVQTKRINNIMSSYQIVRNIWIALKLSEWDTKGISLHKGQDASAVQEYLKHFPVVFLDSTGQYNVCWEMCQGTYCALRRESSLAVDMLDEGKMNSFIPLFMTPVQPLMHFDHIIRFRDVPKTLERVLAKASREHRLSYGADALACARDALYALLARGLGARADLVLQALEADFAWPVKKLPEKMKDGYKPRLWFGLVLNSEKATSVVDKGPPANLPEAEEFRAFWGAKSELRRFQDGSISEACVWDADSPTERRGIARQVVDYLLQLKYDIPSAEVFHVCDQLDSLTARKACGGLQAEEASAPVLRAFDELRRDVRALTDMPLDVSAVYGVSPVFSYCDPFPAVGSAADAKVWRRGQAALIKDKEVKLPEYTPANCAVVELGHSGKWPGDIEAFRCLKAAFHQQLAARLAQQHALPAQAHPAHLDVLKGGLVFRLQLAHPKEVTLLRRELTNGVVRFKETEESVRVQRDTVLMPRLRGALHGLQQKHPCFGPTVCLFKRWLNAHLLSPSHFPSTAAELLAAACFLHSAPLAPPTQPTAGLVRLLGKLATTDWTREMIVLDFNGDMSREEIAELESKFNSRESQTPYMYIVTAYDGDLPSEWTRGAPDVRTVRRAQTLATATLAYLERALLEQCEDNVLGAFVPSLSGYDAFIYLNSALVPYAPERVHRPPLPHTPPATLAHDVIPVVDFNPVDKYLDELRSGYDEFALFFHDACGGDVIAVLWRPGVLEDKELQIGATNALKPVSTGEAPRYRVNVEALLEDWRLLGDGLVREVRLA